MTIRETFVIALYLSLQNHNGAIKALDKRNKELQETIEKLEGLLNDLESGHNPNYVDMAVINTVKAWKTIKGVKDKQVEETPSETDTAEPAKEEDTMASDKVEGDDEGSEESEEDEEWNDTAVRLLLQDSDYVNLMLDHERHMSQGVVGAQAKSMREFPQMQPKRRIDERYIQCFRCRTMFRTTGCRLLTPRRTIWWRPCRLSGWCRSPSIPPLVRPSFFHQRPFIILMSNRRNPARA